MTDPVFTPVGVDYCDRHEGLREEDESRCDNAPRCQTCDGAGELIDGDGDPHMECEDCEGSGRESCDLRPLGYMDEPGKCRSWHWFTGVMRDGEFDWHCRTCDGPPSLPPAILGAEP